MYRGILMMFLGVLIAIPSLAHSETLRVVASFSILADWVKEIGGDDVEVLSLVGMDEDVHVYRAKPTDLAALSRADLLVVNGLGLEGWMFRIVGSSGFSGRILAASDGIDVIKTETSFDHHNHNQKHRHDQSHKDSAEKDPAPGAAALWAADPHGWTSLVQSQIYIQNITRALSSLRPDSASEFQTRMEAYLDRLQTLDALAREAFDQIKPSDRSIVVPHNAFAYLARDYGLTIHSLSGASTRAGSSAQRIAKIVRTIQEQNIRAIFNENISNTKLIERVKDETSAVLAGVLISGALSPSSAPTYIDMMTYNLRLLTTALGSERSFSGASSDL